MNRTKGRYFRQCLLWMIFVISSGAPAKSDIILDTLMIHDKQLCVSFHIEQLFDEKTAQGLERGFISEIRHTLQLWQVKGLYSTIVREKTVLMRLYYDNWTQKYAVVTEKENRLTNNMETLKNFCSRIHALILTPVSELDGKYYLTIQSAFLPISDETYGELSNWVSGRKDEAEKPKRRGRFFSFLVDLLGFGNRNIEFKSSDFNVVNHSRIQFIQ
ncbi:DUF4390 domain-containing protein [candidate division KSB1 bacterium]|nr:DUF4390 domain-containing protein [candidate division KSB1 bacterium]